MKNRIIVFAFFTFILSSCMSMFVGKQVVFKYPKMGVESTGSVGGAMVHFRLTQDNATTNGLKESIVYRGISNNVITLSYQEWEIGSRLTSEPKREQSYQYTLSNSDEPTLITLSNYKLKVIHADNNKIIFILLSGMPDLESE